MTYPMAPRPSSPLTRKRPLQSASVDGGGPDGDAGPDADGAPDSPWAGARFGFGGTSVMETRRERARCRRCGSTSFAAPMSYGGSRHHRRNIYHARASLDGKDSTHH